MQYDIKVGRNLEHILHFTDNFHKAKTMRSPLSILSIIQIKASEYRLPANVVRKYI